MRRNCGAVRGELTEAERGLGEQWQSWQQMRQTLEAEADGLESRIRNLRRKVQEQEQEAQSRACCRPPRRQ